MKLEAEFIKLPFRFDIAKLQQEVLQIDKTDWIPHPNNFEGNMSIPLISVNGEINDDYFGTMKITEALKKLPYIQQVIASFSEIFGRSRLMLLKGGCTVTEHSDANYHWFRHIRIHIPILSNEDVIFHCGDESLHMAEGETWIFDSWQLHRVENHSKETRIHLVLDTCGSNRFWNLVNASVKFPESKYPQNTVNEKEIFIPYKENYHPVISTENYNAPIVMHPGEIDGLVADLITDISTNQENNSDRSREFIHRMHQFCIDWRVLWSKFGDSEKGWPKYQALMDQMKTLDQSIYVGSINAIAKQVFYARVLYAALNPELFEQYQNISADIQKREQIEKPEEIKLHTGSRNALCSCGSGQRYKHCCGKMH